MNHNSEYPDYTAEIDYLDSIKGTAEYENNLPYILKIIIDKHRPNSIHTKKLYGRYKTLDTDVPIFQRKPKYQDSETAVNNKINNDFFSEIVDFFVGYFGTITYSYSEADESKEVTGGAENVERAAKELNDFVTRNSIADKDNEIKKIASICGYVGRLLYHDKEGYERVLITMPYETIVLSDTELTEPKYGVYYSYKKDINKRRYLRAEYYDDEFIYIFEGGSTSDLKFKSKIENLYGYCPLQIIPKNLELMGDAEKVLSIIDAYDRTVSDANNEMENFANAILAFKNMKLDDKDLIKLKQTGSIQFNSLGMNDSDLFYVCKNINDTFIEHHLDRLKNDIYRFSKTPNLSDGTFGSESGEARKFRITGIEARCNTFQSKLETAGVYMFKLLAAAWNKKAIAVDPLQCYMEFKRNFPLDITTEAQAVSTLIACGLPQKIAFTMLSNIDDIDYVMDLIEQEKSGIPSLTETIPEDEEDNSTEE